MAMQTIEAKPLFNKVEFALLFWGVNEILR